MTRLPFAVMSDALYGRLVVPFYLQLMNRNAATGWETVRSELVEAAAVVTEGEVRQLLQDPWRGSVMGAWYAVGVASPQVDAELLGALDRSQGALDAVPLVVAAIERLDGDAISSVLGYCARDLEQGWGAAGLAAAAAQHVEPTATPCPASAADVLAFASLHTVALALRDAVVALRSP